MKALVTGGGGFLGGAIARQLVARGDQVVSFARGDYPELERLGVEVRRGDLAEGDELEEACRDCSVVFHVAAKAGIWGDYQSFYRPNVKGTGRVIQVCRRWGVEKLVFTSSPSVVFQGQDLEGVDESVPYARHYKAAYPETKAMAERLVLEANDNQLATVALRPHLVWGPRDTHLVPGILRRGKSGSLRRVGKTNKLVDFTYIDDAARAHLLAAEKLVPGSPVAGRSYFISQGKPVELWPFIDRILEAGGVPPVRGSISPRLAYLAGWLLERIYRFSGKEEEPRMTCFLAEELATAHWFDISAARRDLGYEPRTGIEEGLRQLRDWLRREETGDATR